MEQQRIERRLAAILAADVVGYSRLMSLDEIGTQRALKAHRKELFDPLLTTHQGRIVKTTGDGVLVEFPSAVEAVASAVATQRAMICRNASVQQDRRIELRVGINVGDVIIDGDDIHGDGVNIAAQLEALAEPGGICISGTAYDQVRDKLPFAFADRGEQPVKNIPHPVRVYALGADAVAALGDIPASIETAQTRRPLASRRIWQTAVGVALALLLVAGGWLAMQPNRSPPPSPSAAQRLSIVVLPFTNLSGDPAQEYLADVITDELTTGLSRAPDSFVISRSTAFTWKGKPIDVHQIGKDLSVRYVLEGSVQPSGNRLRVNAQLIDAENNAHVWADQFDEDRADLLQMEDSIVTRLAAAVGWKMIVEEGGRSAHAHAANPSAQDLSWRCYADFLRGADLADEGKGMGFSLCEEALQIEPRNVLALSTLSFKFSHRVVGYRSSDPEADTRRADELASAALQIDPDFFFGHVAKGDVLLAQRHFREAIDEYQRGLSLNPSMIAAYNGIAGAHIFLGEPELALADVDKALRLSPRDPWTWMFYDSKWTAYGMMQDYERALFWRRRSEAAGPPDNPWKGFVEAVLLALTGHEAEARATMQRYLAGNAPLRTVAQLRGIRVPTDNPRYLAWYEVFIEGMRKAGVPEE